MATEREEKSGQFANRVSIEGGKIDLFRLLERSIITGRVTQIQIISPKPINPEILGELANRAFAISPLSSEQVNTRRQSLERQDDWFAQEFGYTLVPHFACLRIINDSEMEAWISPAFIPPINQKSDENLKAKIFTEKKPLFFFFSLA